MMPPARKKKKKKSSKVNVDLENLNLNEKMQEN